MRFLLLLIAIVSVALGVALPAPGDDAEAPAIVAPEDPGNVTIADTADCVSGPPGCKHPLMAFYTQPFHRGTLWQVGYVEYDCKDKQADAKCVLADPYNHQDFGTLLKSKTPQWYRLQGKHKFICNIYETTDCTGNHYREIDRSVDDLRDIGWQNRIRSVKCWWKS